MPLKTSTPISGRLRLAASELFLSVWGWPVAGSSGGFTLATTAHRSGPQAWMRMVQPSLSSHSPVGSATAGATPTATKAQAANVALRIERALIALSLDLYHPAILERHAAVHPLRQFHVVGGDHSGKPGGAHELGERVEDMTRG